jgi:hypothetical protein
MFSDYSMFHFVTVLFCNVPLCNVWLCNVPFCNVLLCISTVHTVHINPGGDDGCKASKIQLVEENEDTAVVAPHSPADGELVLREEDGGDAALLSKGVVGGE